MKEYIKELKDKKVLVVGLGKSGVAAINSLRKFGTEVEVQDSKAKDQISEKLRASLEKNDVKTYFGTEPKNVEDYDMLVLSPGVPLTTSFVAKAIEANVEVIGELELAYRCCKGKFVGITGTNGKTTSTTLVGEIFKNANRDTRVVGNIGSPVLNEAISANEDTWLITEISSFQLETTKTFKPMISAILNLTPDHMDRHKTLENYGKIKAKILENQNEDGEYVVINFDDKAALKLISGTKAKVVPFSAKEPLIFGVFVEDNKIVLVNEKEMKVEFCNVDELQIPGTHNLENALAAVGIAYFAGIDAEIITSTLKNFKGVEHRLEKCEDINGIHFINDSKGTNPDAAIKAIEAINTDIILIAGGYDKGSNFDKFVESWGDKVKHVVLLGKTAVIIKDAAERGGYKNTVLVKDMKACVEEAFRRAKEGDTVLLSPACASWDMYNSFEERGKDFKENVKALRV